MRYLRLSTFYLLSFLLLTSCEKDIDIDYHEAAPRYVVEASITNLGTKVRISQTNAMDNNSSDSPFDNATVVITGNDGTSETIASSGNGIYTSSLKGVPGVTYQLDVSLDGQHFTSTSTMQRTPSMNKFRLVWQKMFTERYLFGDVRIQDIPNETNHYFVHIYRNKLGYRWAVMKDDTNPNKELQQLFAFFREGSNDSDVLKEGEKLRIVVRAIDQRAYDYLYSMEQMDETGTNPIDNFTGGCLGYFSAHGEMTYEVNYHEAEIEED